MIGFLASLVGLIYTIGKYKSDVKTSKRLAADFDKKDEARRLFVESHKPTKEQLDITRDISSTDDIKEELEYIIGRIIKPWEKTINLSGSKVRTSTLVSQIRLSKIGLLDCTDPHMITGFYAKEDSDVMRYMEVIEYYLKENGTNTRIVSRNVTNAINIINLSQLAYEDT